MGPDDGRPAAAPCVRLQGLEPLSGLDVGSTMRVKALLAALERVFAELTGAGDARDRVEQWFTDRA